MGIGMIFHLFDQIFIYIITLWNRFRQTFLKLEVSDLVQGL